MTPARIRALLVCGALFVVALVGATAWALYVRSQRDEGRALLVKNAFVSAKTGKVLGTAPGAESWAFAIPAAHRPGVFRLREYLVDASNRTSRLDRNFHVGGDGLTVSPTTRVHERATADFAAELPLGSIIVTGKGVALYRGETLVWKNDAVFPEALGTAGVVPIDGGDIVVYAWIEIADSGVAVTRVSGENGKTVWHRDLEPLGAVHSKYRHVAYAEVRDDELVVVSQGSYGSWLEVLDSQSGRKKRRWSYER